MAWKETLARMQGAAAPKKAAPVVGHVARSFRHLTPRQLGKLRNLLFTARTIVEGAYAGRHRSPFKGASPEFVDYREYHPGDELRTINWKAVARTERLFIRLFEKQTDMNVHLMIDTSASMGYGGRRNFDPFDPATLSKLDYALCLGAALAYLIVKQGDKVALTLYSDRVREHLPPGGTFSHLYSMLSAMERTEAGGGTAVAHALRSAYGLCRRRGLLIVVSDLIGEPAELFGALNLYRHRGFDIILFHLLHTHELMLPQMASVDFIDSETGEEVNSHPDEIREAYGRRIRDWIAELRAGARARRIEYESISTATPYSQALQKYMLRRSRL